MNIFTTKFNYAIQLRNTVFNKLILYNNYINPKFACNYDKFRQINIDVVHYIPFPLELRFF